MFKLVSTELIEKNTTKWLSRHVFDLMFIIPLSWKGRRTGCHGNFKRI